MKALFRTQIEGARDHYLKDLEAMSPELLAKKPGGSARSAYDYTYEVVIVNERCLARLKGEEPAAWPGEEGFLTAPADWQDKERAIREYTNSMNAILAAWEDLTDEQIAVTEGKQTPIGLAHFTCIHAMYHDAQLNYLQAIEGDGEVHW